MQTVDFRKLRIAPGHRVLDIGCGTGRHLATVVGYPRITAIGMDRSLDDLMQAKQRIKLHLRLGQYGYGSWGLIGGDVTSLSFIAESFDLVICSEVLEHVPDDEKAIAEITRVLKPGGKLVVSVPRYWPERICWGLSRQYANETGGHVRIYVANKLLGRLHSIGLRIEHRHYAHSLHTPYWWLKCLIGLSRDNAVLVRLYHRLLVWDLMQQPWITRWLERLLNPLLGKSLVLYLIKPT